MNSKTTTWIFAILSALLLGAFITFLILWMKGKKQLAAQKEEAQKKANEDLQKFLEMAKGGRYIKATSANRLKDTGVRAEGNNFKWCKMEVLNSSGNSYSPAWYEWQVCGTQAN